MSEIGLKAYRLSINWPRILPAGTGAVNKPGIDFYDRLIDELLAKGIEPWVTLYHWELPYELFLRGGWLNPEIPEWFAEYTAVVVDKLSDRVSRWMTINEPQCFIGMGYLKGPGIHAPGFKLDMPEALRAAHHALLAHGRSVQTIRSRAKLKPIVGWAPVGESRYPVTDTPANRAATMRGMADVYHDNMWNNVWWGDPVILGHYPEEGLRVYGKNVPKFKDSDMDVIRQPLDFYGCNIYAAVPIEEGPDGNPRAATLPAGFRHTHFTWRVTPEALYWGPKFLSERYKIPVVITENGMSGCDWVALDGSVHDASRIDFLHRYLLSVHQAIADGVRIDGYFHWSILDNFEWAEGYKHRFGLIHVDYETQKRTLKDSAFWYREVIKTNGASLLFKGKHPEDASTAAQPRKSKRELATVLG